MNLQLIAFLICVIICIAAMIIEYVKSRKVSHENKPKIKIRNLYLGIKGQGPFKRFYRNFFITGNAWGLFHIRSHQRDDGKPKVEYPTMEKAQKAATSMETKMNVHFSVYKCIYCDGFHLGKNRDNKINEGK